MKKRKGKIEVQIMNNPEEVLELFEKLGLPVPDELKEALGEIKEQCGNPLCPACIFKDNSTPEQREERTREVFALLTHEELLKAASLMFGICANAYMSTEEPVDTHIGKGLAGMVSYFRKCNEKFNFATSTSNMEQEVAKH